MTRSIETELDARDPGPIPASEVRCADLVTSYLQGGRGDFDELFALTEPVVRRLIGRLAGNRADVDDLVQETYLRAWRGLDKFRGSSRFSTWLFRIAVNVTHNWRRSQRATLTLSEAQGRAIPAPPELADDRLLAAYGQALDRLPEDLKATFVLHESEGLSYRDVAEALGCPIGTVMSRLHRARARLLEDLRERLEELTP